VDPNLIAELPITYDMQEIFRAARAYFALVDKYQDGIHVALDTLADCRNLIQWHIMSLLPGSQLGTRLMDAYPLYESCRLALVIMGVGVVFPLPVGSRSDVAGRAPVDEGLCQGLFVGEHETCVLVFDSWRYRCNWILRKTVVC
jgi:hypothetical protein